VGPAEPATARLYDPRDGGQPAPWEEARRRLEEATFFWLATARPDGRPHLTPVLAVVVDGTPHFCAGGATRKARNLAAGGRCSLATAAERMHLVVEGTAAPVGDGARLRRVAGAYAAKYGWPVTVREGALHGDGAPTAGPPPYRVYALRPEVAFGFGEDETVTATRWDFAPPGP
jgi:hypothetical protein